MLFLLGPSLGPAGKLIESSGTMSGGGATPKGGAPALAFPSLPLVPRSSPKFPPLIGPTRRPLPLLPGRMRVGNSAPRAAESTAELEKSLAAAEKELDSLEARSRPDSSHLKLIETLPAGGFRFRSDANAT